MESQKSEKLQNHLRVEHSQSPLAEYLKEIVYGGNDGIVTTFAVVAGFSGASIMGDDTLGLTFMTVMLFGLANLFADGLSMALGNFLSVRADKDVYEAQKRKETKEIRQHPELEAEETVDILISKGFSLEDARQLTQIYRKNEAYWADWMMVNELEAPDPSGVNPVYTGLATFISFTVFGFIPLLPFMLLGDGAEKAFIASIAATLSALVSLGLLRWRVIGGGLVRSVGEIVLIGGSAAVVAFLVGFFFKG